MMITVDTPTEWRRIRFKVLERIEHLPSLNSVVVEFLTLAGAEFFTAKDFEAILSKDQALVGRLLKVANSGLYGRTRTVASIPEAVVLIGLENLKKIVYTVSAEGLTRNAMVHYDYHENQGFWHHAMGVASAARIVADASSSCRLHGEEGFVAGLLHDVGKLIIDDFLDMPQGSRVSRQDEEEAVGIDHAELSAYVLTQWNLPETITATVRHHHDYQNGGEWASGAAALVLAQGICGHWGIGHQSTVDLSEDIPSSPYLDVLDTLRIPTSSWDQIIWDVRQNLVKMGELFSES